MDDVIDLKKAMAKMPKPSSDNNWQCAYEISKEEADMIAEPKFIHENLIIHGHLSIYPAEPGAGKTTIFLYIAEKLALDYRVYYINADTAGNDAKELRQKAEDAGFTMMLPDMKVGLSMETIITKFEEMNEVDVDYSRDVYIFDTFKKMTNVINKSKAKDLLKLLRGLTAKGMTIILLAHTNKYENDGEPVYEGTGDVKSDVDEMIYFVKTKNDDGSMTVSTKLEKTRGAFEPITFHITKDRKVTQENYIDVLSINHAAKQLETDQSSIEAITSAINNGLNKQIEIANYCKYECSIGVTRTSKVLTRYKRKLWSVERLSQNNAVRYSLISTPPV